MTAQEVILLIQRYQDGSATEQERAKLETGYVDYSRKYADLDFPADLWLRKTAGLKLILNEGTGDLQEQGEKVSAKRISLWPRIAGIAAAVALITFGIWFFASRHPDEGQDPGSARYANDINPGKNGATITLANGKVIALDSAKNGVVIGDKLAYSDGTPVGRHPEFISGSRTDKTIGESSMMLTASTARGQTYQVTLPDGTRVWLNADSKISFNSQFSGQIRKVLLSGEAYFEVEKDASRPFMVAVNNQTVKVLGTHFNINGYKDEAWTVTTLLEGSVQVDTEKDHKLLKPGQESVGDVRGLVVRAADVEGVVSWKNGYFQFDAEELESVMKKLSRWYDVEVQYENEEIKNVKFTGTMSRYDHIDQVLRKIAGVSNMKYSIRGKTVVLK